MGEVYRATDRNLKREVAIKVLPEALAADRERLARFEREAEVLASLNHPNIAAIYGLERADNQTALVMELVEGQTLADRIAQGALTLEETLPIAKQIAEALEAAHEQGIVHRDLKPANVKLRPDGAVKLLDFGLAKATSPMAISSGLSQSPTITTPAMTQAGMILGTAAYMSPEQARGKHVDRRADIWAFGCVLYEMLSGRRAFEDEDVSLTLSRILQREPAFEALPPGIPAHIRQTVQLCLKKPLKERIPDIGAVRLALEGVFATAAREATAPSAPRTWTAWQRTAALLGVAVCAAVAGGLVVWRLTPAPASAPQTVARFAIPASASVAPGGAGTGRHALAMSPDGTRLVYWADDQLLVRRLDSLDEAVPIRGTEGSREPFFSPDGQWIGFHREGEFNRVGEIRRVSVSGGAPVLVTAARNPWGVTWDADGMIRYGQGADGIWQVSAGGGMPSQLIALEKGEQAHGPQLLPGGEWVLFTFRPATIDSWDQAQIVAQSLRTRERVVLIERGRDARYLPTGHLVYGLSGVLLAVPFDLSQRRATGAAEPVVEGVMDGDARTGAMHFTVSDSGSLVYLAGASGLRRSLTWVSREGRLEGLPAEPLPYDSPRISPDGQRIAVNLNGTDGPDVHVYDLVRNQLTQVTSSPLRGRNALWTRDGKRVVFYSDRNGGGLHSMAVDGTGAVDRLTTTRAVQTPYSWSADGRDHRARATGHRPDHAGRHLCVVTRRQGRRHSARSYTRQRSRAGGLTRWAMAGLHLVGGSRQT